jgi:hypothetical protein
VGAASRSPPARPAAKFRSPPPWGAGLVRWRGGAGPPHPKHWGPAAPPAAPGVRPKHSALSHDIQTSQGQQSSARRHMSTRAISSSSTAMLNSPAQSMIFDGSSTLQHGSSPSRGARRRRCSCGWWRSGERRRGAACGVEIRRERARLRPLQPRLHFLPSPASLPSLRRHLLRSVRGRQGYRDCWVDRGGAHLPHVPRNGPCE